MQPDEFRVAARLYRRAISEHDFSEPQQRILDAVLRFSLDLGRYWAPFIRQRFICEACPDLNPPKVSKELGYLMEARVVDMEKVPVTIHRRKALWKTFCVNPPGRWLPAVQLRQATSKAREDLLTWLEGLDPHQPELIAVPPQLDHLLREDFVESNRFTNFAGEPGESRVERASEPQKSYPGDNFLQKVAQQATFEESQKVIPGATFDQKVIPQATFGEVPCTTRAPARFESIESISRSFVRDTHNARALADKTFSLIGDCERTGSSARHWLAFIFQLPCAEELLEKLKLLVDAKQLSSPPVRWLMRSSKNAMEEAQIVPLPNFPKTEHEAVAYAALIGCPEDVAVEEWEQAMSRGGNDSKGQPITSFHYYLAKCWKYRRARLEENKNERYQPGGRSRNDGTYNKPNGDYENAAL